MVVIDYDTDVSEWFLSLLQTEIDANEFKNN